MKIYDVFLYHNEDHLLELRLREHNPFVDHFVLIEADHTHAGKPKPFHFDIASPRWAAYRQKIIVLRSPLAPPPVSPWTNEAVQRNFYLSALKLDPNDLVNLADIDEVTSRFHWKRLLEEVRERDCVALWHRFFYYYLNLESSQPWFSGRLMKASFLEKIQQTPDDFRKRPYLSTTVPCGWHFSYLMTAEGIAEKLSSFSHTEYDNDHFNTPEKIQRALKEKSDLFLRPGFHYTVREIDQSWPLAVLENPSAWEMYVCDRTWKDRAIEAKRALRRVASQIKHRSRQVIVPEPPAGAKPSAFRCATNYVQQLYPELAVNGAPPLNELLARLKSYVAEGLDCGFVTLTAAQARDTWLATIAASVYKGIVVIANGFPPAELEKVQKVGLPEFLKLRAQSAAAA